MPASFVAFRQHYFLVDRLDSPVLPPYAIGSSLGGVPLTSSDATVVGVDGLGNLIGHRNGKATIRAPTGATLAVEVRAAKHLSIEPARLSLAAGASQKVAVLGDGKDVSSLVTWSTMSPDVAAASGEAVQAGLTAGTTKLTAILGAASATIEVAVHPADGGRVALTPSRASVRAGSMQQFRAESSRGVAPVWESSDPAVLQSLRDGIFNAKTAGEAKACAVAGNTRACASVRVTRQ